MIAVRSFHGSVCASCRLRASIAAKQVARSRNAALKLQPSRLLSGSAVFRYPRDRSKRTIIPNSGMLKQDEVEARAIAKNILSARQEYGNAVPEGLFGEEERRVYERMFGPIVPSEGRRGDVGLDVEGGVGMKGDGEGEGLGAGTGVLRLADDGALEEIEYEDDGKKVRKAWRRGIDEGLEEEVVEDEDTKLARDEARNSYDEVFSEAEAQESEDQQDHTTRTHPLTAMNRFGTSPSTFQLPNDTFVDPATVLLSGLPNTHLTDAAHRTFGGIGLPYSPSTPKLLKSMQAKPIALDAYQERMSEIEGDVYLATIMPAVLGSVVSVLTEVRKRLGSTWAEELVRKAEKGELRILDAGGAGAGVMAVREVLRAEWERMHEEPDSAMSLAEADGKVGGAGVAPPLGSATVLTASDALRKRASQLLENTTFIPRLPDYVHAKSEQARQKGKFDIIIAPHTLWPLREDYVRRTHAQNLWSLLKADGGVLVLLEKGVARGFELIASARELLLDTRISSPESRAQNLDIGSPPEPHVEWEGSPSSLEPEPLSRRKEKGMIIAPCTNHSACPMYIPKGMQKGRKDICHFEQRYVRPGFLQRILGARDKNFEDVKFSYLAVMRGEDLREVGEEVEEGVEGDVMGGGGMGRSGSVVQGKEATERAFEGYLDVVPPANNEESESETAKVDESAAIPHSLTLPRAILPPLKRRGHVILDLCTPSGTLERWTVPRSYSKQAFRGARKSSWGDLWALGAKTRVLRTVRKNKHAGKADLTIEKRTGTMRHKRAKDKAGEGLGLDEYGHIVVGGDMGGDREGGKMRTRKVKGIRDKRDKSGKGNGRRKRQVED